MSASLDAILTPRKTSESTYDLDVPEGWRQGRGAFGGLVLGLLVRSAEDAAGGPERALRSLTAELIGPVQAGRARITVEVLRVGSGVTTVAARLVQADETHAHAVIVFGRARDASPDVATIDAPSPPDWRDVAEVPLEMPGAPEFARFFEFRNLGPLPFRGGPVAEVSGFVRPRAPCSRRDAAWLVAKADAWWPTFFSTARAPRPMATVSFTFEPVGSLEGLEPEAPLFHRARLLASREGYVVELRELWTPEGRLLSLNHQTFVLIR